jgi:hypothetical protein
MSMGSARPHGWEEEGVFIPRREEAAVRNVDGTS